MKKESLIALLERTLESIKQDDSMEGRIQYTFDSDNPGEFLVDAFIRVGNSDGQGSCIVVTEIESRARSIKNSDKRDFKRVI